MTPWRLPTKWWRCVRRTSTRQKAPGKGGMSSSTEEKTGIQALERAAPTLPMQPGLVERPE